MSEISESAAPIPAVDPRLLVREQGLAGYLAEFKRKLRSGDLGSVPVVLGLILIAVVFQAITGKFLTAGNLSNITLYIAGPGLISVGIVFVLLLGEIDLSLGSVAGVSAAISAVLSIQHGVNEYAAAGIAVLCALAIGALHGFFFARIGVPAFVVTLAGLLGWSGLQGYVMGNTGTLNNIPNGFIANLDNYFFDDVAAAYGLAAIGVAGYLVAALLGARSRREAGLPARPVSEIALRTALLAVLAFGAAYTLNQDRGLPLALVVFLGVVVITDFVLRRTSYGRKVFAVGGGVEAARRAGINVAWVRISVFMISAGLAAVGGLFIASQSGFADKSLGSGNVLMNSIAAAVIGGTSLFGGRGKTWSALLGMLVIQSIVTGLDLQGISQSIQYMITGAVLLGAVVLDSVSRRTQKSAGRG
ncbi:sugar ABC transporter permease [Kitasatospora kifunensis]|uniref:Xylose transport system permease protein XylH n=1 Tax=Kitasatospora kifunensis TaxID=58351 RepID=A0A7W7R5Q9_KITKI|nr:sugar ABC transporter permease [Kitasatospora kifunensis]MBB4925790.1 D-xylose transport system permease protein [Kitasatospora kifunensis]